MSDPAPGWYTDPEDARQQRYWDGSAWTEHRVPGGSASTGAPSGPETPGSATASLVLGILSLVMCGLFTGVPAMITGRRAMREIDASGGRLGGRGLAQAGFITGLVGTLLTTLALVFVVALLAIGAAVQTGFEDTCDTVNPDPISNPECF